MSKLTTISGTFPDGTRAVAAWVTSLLHEGFAGKGEDAIARRLAQDGIVPSTVSDDGVKVYYRVVSMVQNAPVRSDNYADASSLQQAGLAVGGAIDRIESELAACLGAEFVGYSGPDVLAEGEVPPGSKLPTPDSGKVYVRDADNRGWLLVPAEWAKSKSPTFTSGRNPATGREEPQLCPPGITERGKHYGQPYYTDGEAFGGTGGALRITRAPVKLSRQITVDTPTPRSSSAPSDSPSSSPVQSTLSTLSSPTAASPSSTPSDSSSSSPTSPSSQLTKVVKIGGIAAGVGLVLYALFGRQKA